MSFYNTGNPVPSIDPRDLDDNAKHIDEIVNSTLPTFVDRLGSERQTLFGIIEDNNSLATNLANETDQAKGATLVGYEGRTLRDVLNDKINILNFIGLTVGGTRWDIALQAAIAKVETLAVAANRTWGLPEIEVPGGLFPMGAAVTTRPWIKIVARGTVTFDWSLLPASNGIVINNQITIPDVFLKHPGNHSPCLNGNEGTITLLGSGKATSTGSALLIGNSSAGFQPCRDTRLSCVVVSGWDNAQKFNLRDTYLFRATDCRFENNNKNINVPTGTNSNSGERMEYVGCTFALADYQLYQDNVTFDFSFIGCSFDFSGSHVTYGTSAAYCSARFTTCYFEAWDGYVVDAPAAGEQVAVFFTDGVFLPRKWKVSTIVNSPSRVLVNTNDKVSISWGNSKMRYETRPYLEDSYTITAATRLESYTGYHFNPQMGIPSAANIINRDYDFQIDADGTLGNALTAWDRLAGFTAVTTNQIATVSGKKVLQLVGTDAVTAAITFRGKDSIPAKPGDQFLCTACIQADGVTGNINVLMGVEFFDIAGVSLGSFPSFRQYTFKDALADTTLPNFASGGTRYMDTTGFKAIAPKNTATAKARFTMTAFSGTVNVSRARVWRW